MFVCNLKLQQKTLSYTVRYGLGFLATDYMSFLQSSGTQWPNYLTKYLCAIVLSSLVGVCTISGPIRPGQKMVCIVGHSFVRHMKNYISNDTNHRHSNLNLPVAKFRVRLEGYGGWKMHNLHSWLPTSFGEEKIDLI